MRQYERHYSTLNKQRVHVLQSIDMQLQRCNIRFSNYISDIGSQAMRKVIRSIISGVTSCSELIKYAHTQTKNKYGESAIKESLNRVVSQVDIDMLTLFWAEV